MATTLSAGDIGFVQFNADGADNFVFVLLTNIDADTVINFTDDGWLAAGGLRTGEGVLAWTPGVALGIGTAITVTAAGAASIGTVSTLEGSLNFSGSGDQLIAFQGTVAAPTAIAALNNDGAGVFQADATNTNTSALPTGLAAGASAVAIAEVDNVAYSGATTDDLATLRAALFDAANWTTGDNSANQTFSGAFTVTDAGPDAIAPALIGSSPADDVAGVALDASVTLTFTETIVLADAAGVALRRVSDTTAIAGVVTVSGNALTIDPSVDLANGEGVYVEISATAITDAAANAFAGLAGADALNFTTIAAGPAPSIVINEIHADPASDLTGDANGDGTRSSGDDEFVELVNTGAGPLDLAGWTLSDGAGLRHVFPAGTVLAAGQAIVVFGGGAPTGDFGASLVQTASSGSLSLNNSGDTVTLADTLAAVIATLTYGSTGGDNQSLTRSPDLTGEFVKHSTVDTALFSPGTEVDGGYFVDPADLLAINELRVNKTGAEADFIELYGLGGVALNGLTLLSISGEFAPGKIDFAFDLTGGVTDADGFFLLSNGTHTLDSGDLSVTFDFFGTPQTMLLVKDFTGAVGDDLDTDNDGVLDTTPWAKLIDGVALVDGDATADLSYGADIVGPDGSFTAGGAAAIPNGGGAFTQLAFGTDGADTPGRSNNPADAPATAYFIHDIQGAGAASPLVGVTVIVEAVVTFLAPGLSGFWVQEEDADADADASTSEGIFVFADLSTYALGDLLQITGTVNEFFDSTQINAADVVSLSSGNALPTAALITINPTEGAAAAQARFETVEGMLVRVISGGADPLTVTENYQLGRFGEVEVSSGTRIQPTQILDPQDDAAAITALMDANLGNHLVIDDAISTQNQTTLVLVDRGDGQSLSTTDNSGAPIGPDGPTLRIGAEFTSIEGVMAYSFSEYRVTVDGPLTPVDGTNDRPDGPPDVGGALKVASYNVLNFFTTIDDGVGTSGPNALDPRGADTPEEYIRQLAKTVEGITKLNADVVGLQELENNGFGPGSAIAALVDALNAKLGAAVYAFVDPTTDAGYIGTDAITTGIIYKTASVQVTGADFLVYQEASANQTVTDLGVTDLPRNRPTVAAAFVDEGGATFTVAVNHFKSKGPSGLDAFAGSTDINVDQGDGQGYWNGARTDAANELAAWLATDPFDTGDTDALVIGDLNAYAEEDPVEALEDAGYINLIDAFVGNDEAYSYTFDGQRGALDQALATGSLAAQVTGIGEWHINADEPGVLSYDDSFDATEFYYPDEFQASDHDPLLIGLDLTGPEMGATSWEIAAARRGRPAGVESIDGDAVAISSLTTFVGEKTLAAIGVTISSASQTSVTQTRFTNDGIGAMSRGDHVIGDVRTSASNRSTINGDEELIFALDSIAAGVTSGLGDAYGMAMSFGDVTGAASAAVDFWLDGEMIDTMILDISSGAATAWLGFGAQFDEAHLSAEGDTAFALDGFEFMRELHYIA